MTSIVRRVVAGFGANAFGQVVQVAIQLLSFPLFLRQWDTEQYGVWLMLSATPAYLAMADVGMVTTAGNRMTMEMARGDITLVNRVFQSALALTATVCVGIALVVISYCLFGPIPGISSLDERIALCALALGVLVAPIGGLTEAIFRATGRFPTSASIAALTRLAEWGGWLLGLWLYGTFAAVALMGLLFRLLGTGVAMAWANHRSQGIEWGIRHARLGEIRQMLVPSLSFMSFPLASALSLQGITLLVGHFFGPALVTAFSAFRTLARVTVQMTSMFSHAIWPEFSRLFGHGAAQAVRGVYFRAELLGFSISIALSLVLFACGPWLLEVWTHGLVVFRPMLMGLLLGYAAVAGAAHVPRTFLMAINEHIGYSRWNILAGVTVVALVALIGNSMGLEGVGLAMLAVETVLSALCVGMVRETLREGQAKTLVKTP